LPRFGHAESLDREWLGALSPKVAIATVSAFNRRGLPHPRSREMLTEVGGRLLTTGDCGALSMRFGAGNSLRASAELSARPRFWRNSANCGASGMNQQ